MSLSNSTLEPAEAVLRRVERDTYSVADVRKALSYLLAHVEKGDAPPTPWVVANKILGMPAMYYPVRACVFTLLPHAKHVLARAIHASGPAPTRVLNRSFPTITPALLAQLKAAWEGIEKIPVEARRAAIAVYEPPRKGGAKSSINIFSDDEEDILVSFSQHRPGRHLPREQGVCARAHVGRCADMSYVALCESARAVRQHHNVIVFRNTCDTTVFMCEKWWVSVTDHRMVEVARLGAGATALSRQVSLYPAG